MTTSELLENELNRLTTRGVSGGYPLELAVPGGRVQCRLESLDAIGCSLQAIQWQSDSTHSPAELRAMAQWLCGQVRYLLEPLRVIETDPEGEHVQVRSDPPTRQPQATNYYEAVISHSRIALQRYSAAPGMPRQAIPMQLTREMLGRLVEDLADAPRHMVTVPR